MITLIYIIYIVVYGYSTYMTSIEPENTYWGYICVYIFTFLAIWSIRMFSENSKNNEEDK